MKRNQEKLSLIGGWRSICGAQYCERGFTIIELLTVFAISAAIAVVVIASYPNFSSKIEFDNLATDIALTIREAQVYGISAREEGSSFDVPYGVHFDIRTAGGNPYSYILFADLDENNEYDDTSGDSIIEQYTMKEIYQISELCVTRASGENCDLDTTVPLDITFKRPNPDAVFRMGALSDYYKADIKIYNTKNNSAKTITVTDTGQISVN